MDNKEVVMSKKKTIGAITGIVVGTTVVAARIMKKKAKKTTYKAENIDSVPVRKRGFYEKYIKRVCDVICATGAIVCFSPLYICVAVLVKLKLGSPVLFTQDRPGLVDKDGKETIFKMYKFRTMTDERDEKGDLLPDEVRLTKFGKWLRNTSLDGYDIIGQTRKSLENRGFREVSPMNFFDNHTRFGWYSCDMRIATV